ncbi:response regulator transcription factor [Dechloromonas sp. XY25]|uniref:Response regulator transcription factor n=1 Tax=Dechloromonas hankyongensis TaxID=2908002 RepID=A0ABS9K676_9RHOO|nr:response regulator transcription factor [Dechloromonas hankyongensis]MCG2578673.1 response regulator transcription factor [Dechloromonas hankyongensis]
MNKKYRLLIADDHALLRAGLRALLTQEPDLEVVGEADNGREVVGIAGTASPDLVLMDITMPGTNGIEAIANLKRRYPAIRVLVLTIHNTHEYIQESLSAGADGYILKGASQDELRLAVRTVLQGKVYLSPDISECIVSGYLGGGKSAVPTTAWNKLTQREREVLKLIAEGNSSKLIAEYLYLSVKTVDKHRSNLMNKLDIHNASRLTGFAIKQGLLAGFGRE